MSPRSARRFALPALAFLAVLGSALGCNVPVFRFALDRWPGETYELKTDFTEVAEVAREANLKLSKGGDGGKQELFAPYDKRTPLWTGKLDDDSLAMLVDSPQRKEIARRVLSGDSAVWGLVESGDKKADTELFERLDDRLTFFQSVAELPEIDPDDPTSQLVVRILELKFSILRLRRDDPNEALLVKMLAGPKAAKLPETEPFVAPVFGRGRVLGAWTADTMDAEGIDEASFYLTGACSCEVKAQNPGWDLLLSADWEKELRSAERRKSSEKTEAAERPNEPAKADETKQPEPPAEKTEEAEPESSPEK